MTNLFNAVKQLSDETIREQLALFEVFTMANRYKEAGHKVAKQFVKATNVVTGLMKKSPIQEPEGFSIDEAFQQHKAKRAEEETEVLQLEMKKLLIERSDLIEGASEDAISIWIINEASEIYELKEELLPSQKADWIAKYYKEEIKAFQEEEGNNAYALFKLKTPLGNKKMLRHLFAQLVAICVEAYGGQMTTKEEELPSWLNKKDKETLRRSYEVLHYESMKDEANYEKALQKLFENNQCIAAKNKLLEEEEKTQEALKKCVEKLKIEVEAREAQGQVKEVHMKKAQLKSYEALITMSQEEVKSAELYMGRWKGDNEKLSKEVEKALKKKEATIQQIADKKEVQHQARENKWKMIYSDFAFEPHCLQNIRDMLSLDEIIDCERVLMELSHMKDKKAISWEEEGRQHFPFTYSNNAIGVLRYQVVEDKPYKVNIRQIEKFEQEE